MCPGWLEYLICQIKDCDYGDESEVVDAIYLCDAPHSAVLGCEVPADKFKYFGYTTFSFEYYGFNTTTSPLEKT